MNSILPTHIFPEFSAVLDNQAKVGKQLKRLFAFSLASYFLEHPTALLLIQGTQDFFVGLQKTEASLVPILPNEDVSFVGQLVRIDLPYVKKIAAEHTDAIYVSLAAEQCLALDELPGYLNRWSRDLLSINPKNSQLSFTGANTMGSPTSIVMTPSPEFSIALHFAGRKLATLLSPVFSEGTDGVTGEYWGFHLPILSIIQSELQHVVVSKDNFSDLCRVLNVSAQEVWLEAEQSRLLSQQGITLQDTRKPSRAL